MPDPRSIEGQVFESLRRISRALELHSRLLHQQVGLTARQLTVLRVIERSPQLTTGDLARQMHLGKATMTGILDRLEARGLIVRRRGQCDRRSVTIELTDCAQTRLADAPSAVQSGLRDQLAQLADWEQTQILATLQRVASMMDTPASEEEAPLPPV